ncbi:unnamed protein product [Schistosoma margrebowiei]|uniref:Uncharacterized protein n=1 Tax=Schistosoma margrebowiei TaxID=48269 RepID=A0A183MIP4_9TREM|nr:unnamed protein product [Schistosoma margrebowiei]
MKTLSEGKHGIQWAAAMQLDDMVFADDLALLSHTHEQMRMKTACAAETSEGVNIHKQKSRSPNTTRRGY